MNSEKTRTIMGNSAVRDTVQGVACLAILWYIVFGDPSRLSEEWFGRVPGGLLSSAPFFLFWMLMIYFVEGTRAAEWGRYEKNSPVRHALNYYFTYWKVCAPLTLVGYLLFSIHIESPLYCPMFENLGFLNVSRAILALTNNIHEGAWLVSSVAICAFCASLWFRVREKKGTAAAAIVIVAGIVAHCALYLVVMPFMYHKRVFPVAAVAGSACFAVGFLLGNSQNVWDSCARRLGELSDSGAFMKITRPVRYIGRNWLAFWIAQFFVTCYYYSVAASVHLMFVHPILRYLAFLLLNTGLIRVLQWCFDDGLKLLKENRRMIPAALLMAAVPFLLRQALELSMDNYAQFGFLARQQWPVYVIVTAAAIACLIMVLRAMTGHWLPAALVVTALMTLLGIANHYTMKYHGALLTIEDIHNVKTAAGVIHSYDLSIDGIAGKILVVGAAAAICCIVAWMIVRKQRKKLTRRQNWTRRGAILLTALCGLSLLYFTPEPVIERQDNIWSWGSLYAKIGYLSGTVESTLANLSFAVHKPEGYSAERIAELKAQAEQAPGDAAPAKPGDYPDIVMILNETWYDLDQYIDTHADVDYLKNYRALDNAVKGYAEVPLTGGGTNGTEYEMLTGNTMSLINAYAPFNRLNFTETVSLPGYLEALGYTTLAAHPHESQNYHRGISWSQMGVDNIYFIHDFTDLEFYADRRKDHEITDTSALKNVIRFMEDMPEDAPRFAFLVTMQNHGGWTTNQPEQALVHSSLNTDDEELVNKIDEFLSCLTFTDAMIEYMQQYYTRLYEETGRRVVVCMVGDHSPSFLPDLENLCKWQDGALAERKGKSTPYFIWANYPLDAENLELEGTEDMDLCCLMPTMLEAAGIPLSYYYRYIRDMNRDVAVYTNVGIEKGEEAEHIAFYDRGGQLHHVDEDSPVSREVLDYMYMAYNLTGTDGAIEESLFRLPGGDG